MMPKYIDAEALKAVMVFSQKTGNLTVPEMRDILSLIDSVPAADVEPRGRWIPVTDTENLPKRSTPCLVACNQWGGEIVRKATWLASERIFHENGRDITEYVTHWMDSPRAPEEVRHAAP